MAVCRTIRTKSGISKFIIPSENGDEYVTAFQYDDDKVEVHSLKKECAPLYLEENTTVNTLTFENCPLTLLAITPRLATSSLEIRLWDVTSPLGFTPKEVSLKEESKKDGKFKCLLNINIFTNESLMSHICTTIGSLVGIIVNEKYCVLLKAKKSESLVTAFNIMASFPLNYVSPVVDALFLSDQQKTYLCLGEGCNVNVMTVEQQNLAPVNNISVAVKRSKASHIASFSKLTCSKCLVCDNMGHLSLLHVSKDLTPLKFPSTVGGHSIHCVIGFKHTTEGILAICNSDYTINLYKLADILCSVNNGVSTYVKPYRSLCSQFPINSITFGRSDLLVMASASNQSLTFWGGFSSTIITGG